jgi:MFS family permease
VIYKNAKLPTSPTSVSPSLPEVSWSELFLGTLLSCTLVGSGTVVVQSLIGGELLNSATLWSAMERSAKTVLSMTVSMVVYSVVRRRDAGAYYDSISAAVFAAIFNPEFLLLILAGAIIGVFVGLFSPLSRMMRRENLSERSTSVKEPKGGSDP